MATVIIDLPDRVMGFLEERARSGPYADAGAYLRDLIERDRERMLKIARMQALVDEARAGGPSGQSMDDIRRTARAALGLTAEGNALDHETAGHDAHG